MSNFFAPGLVAGLLVLVGSIANAAGYPIAGAILSDPATAGSVTMIVTGVGGLVAGILAGVRRPAA